MSYLGNTQLKLQSLGLHCFISGSYWQQASDFTVMDGWKRQGPSHKTIKGNEESYQNICKHPVILVKESTNFLSGPDHYIHSPVKAGALERAQFLPPQAASPGGGTNRKTKHEVGLRTRVLSLRNCSWSSSLLHQKTRAREMCISCQI